MTLNKNSTNYNIQDEIDGVKVTGLASVSHDGTISISINTDNGGYASYTRGIDGYINFNSSFNEANDLIDYVQNLIGEIRIELDNIQ